MPGNWYAAVVAALASAVGVVFALGAIDAGLPPALALLVGVAAVVIVFLLMYV